LRDSPFRKKSNSACWPKSSAFTAEIRISSVFEPAVFAPHRQPLRRAERRDRRSAGQLRARDADKGSFRNVGRDYRFWSIRRIVASDTPTVFAIARPERPLEAVSPTAWTVDDPSPSASRSSCLVCARSGGRPLDALADDLPLELCEGTSDVEHRPWASKYPRPHEARRTRFRGLGTRLAPRLGERPSETSDRIGRQRLQTAFSRLP
jgi:hypothetical protein